MTISINSARQQRINTIAARMGKTPAAITNKALDLYLEELEDYLEVQEIKKQGMTTIPLAELGKRLGLES